jgi:hypothetical protein
VRAKDTAGNLMPAPFTWSFSTTGAAACPCTLFGNLTPSNPTTDDPDNYELGVKFQSDVAATVTGVRFYKVNTNTGTHTGTLWSATGQVLATGTFTNETASGWQTLTFGTPVPISAGVTYVVSYTDPNGHYAGSSGFFANGWDSGQLHVVLPSGVYSVGPGFPTNTFNSANYWVDVVFKQTLP